MAKLALYRTTTGLIARLYVQDTASTIGGGLTGLAYNSAGLTAAYMRAGDLSATTVTLVSGTPGTYASGGFVAADPANLPGVYEVGIPNVALAVGGSVLFMLRGAANMAPVLAEFQLDAVNYQDATRFGLSALPNANAGTPAGIGDTVRWNGAAVTGMPMPAYTQPTGFLSATFPTTGTVSTYAGVDTPGTTTLLGRLTDARAAKLDLLDAAISSVVTAVGAVLTAVGNVWTSATRTLTGKTAATLVANDVTGSLPATLAPTDPTAQTIANALSGVQRPNTTDGLVTVGRRPL